MITPSRPRGRERTTLLSRIGAERRMLTDDSRARRFHPVDRAPSFPRGFYVLSPQRFQCFPPLSFPLLIIALIRLSSLAPRNTSPSLDLEPTRASHSFGPLYTLSARSYASPIQPQRTYTHINSFNMRSSLLALFGAVAVATAASLTPMTDDDLDLADLQRRGYIVEERDVDESAWQDVSFGIMMERSPVPGTSLTSLRERSLIAPAQPSGLQTRDGERMEILLERTASGSLNLPRSWEEAKEMVKRSGEQAVGHLKRNSRIAKRFSAIITWYTGARRVLPRSSLPDLIKRALLQVAISWARPASPTLAGTPPTTASSLP